MRTRSYWNKAYRLLNFYQWISAVLVTSISLSLKTDTAKWGAGQSLPAFLAFSRLVVITLQENAWWMIAFLSITGTGAKIACKQIGPPWVWEHVHFLLDKFQELIFEGEVGESHHHRVTLFKHVPFAGCRVWNWNGFLIPVERSGHTTMKCSVVFCAPDDADKAEGIAGATWAGKKVFKVQDLPEFWNHKAGKSPFNKKLEEYAKITRVTCDWLKTKHITTRSRSLWGVHVEVKGRIWGVIVVDSRAPQFRNPQAIDLFWKTNGRYFSKLLEKA